MHNLEKRHNKELRDSVNYMSPGSFWVKVIILLSIIIGVMASEYLTRGKMSPYEDGGWITYLVHCIVRTIQRYISEIVMTMKEALKSFQF